MSSGASQCPALECHGSPDSLSGLAGTPTSVQRFGVLPWLSLRTTPAFIGLACAFVVAPWGVALAEGSGTVEIDYQAPRGCGGAQEFWRALRRRMPSTRWVARGPADISLVVHLTRVGREVRGHLRLQTGQDQDETDLREVAGTECLEVVDALALTAALAIEQLGDKSSAGSPRDANESGPVSASSEGAAEGDEGLAPRSSEETLESSSRESSEPRGKPAAERERGDEESDEEEDATGRLSTEDSVPPSDQAIGAQAFVTQVVAPTVSLGVGLDARSSFPLTTEWQPSFGVSLLHVPSELLQPAGDAAVGWTAVDAQACPTDWRFSARVLIVPCATGSIGWVSVTGTTSMEPTTVRRFWVAVGALARAEFHVASETSLDLSTELQVPVLAREFETTRPRQTVAATPSVTWRTAMGVAYHF